MRDEGEKGFVGDYVQMGCTVIGVKDKETFPESSFATQHQWMTSYTNISYSLISAAFVTVTFFCVLGSSLWKVG